MAAVSNENAEIRLSIYSLLALEWTNMINFTAKVDRRM